MVNILGGDESAVWLVEVELQTPPFVAPPVERLWSSEAWESADYPREGARTGTLLGCRRTLARQEPRNPGRQVLPAEKYLVNYLSSTTKLNIEKSLISLEGHLSTPSQLRKSDF